MLERALAIQEKRCKPYHLEVAITLKNLGIVYGALGNHKKKKELLARALPIFEKHYGPDSPEVAALLAELDDV